ncbi:hypothetical protein Hypma_003895 [Hypsizygus marmoreus]|uniref:MYND-type domain-containing protein n=1 Tax=Hypsizygus marmoreus TaxID=39966 RepID=A0A369K0J1_HYPMA|nr:hypothetical protein Hypma_003895 [Hypsizygus marmoreus]
MPGPGHRKKAKPRAASSTSARATSSSASSPDAYVGDIDHAETWNTIVDILCIVFEIPDITTRSGLKKVHSNFEAIYRRLDKACQKYPENERIVGGVVGIYAKMCADSILRNKLFERGLLDKLMPLLDHDYSRHMALRALGTITHHGGASIRRDIARHTAKLTKLVEQFPDDENLIELVITIISHSVSTVVEGDRPADPALLASLDMRTVLKLTTENTKKEWATPYLINHAMVLLAMSTLHASAACKGYPPMQKFLVAGLRSTDWVTRCTCLGGVIRLHRAESERDMRALDPYKFLEHIQRGFAPHLQDRMSAYGFPRCDTYLTLKTSRDYQNAMMTCAQDKNLYSLGLQLAEFILRTEFSISDGMFQTQDPRTGRFETMSDLGLPFTMWIDALPLCARAIRTRAHPHEADLADILDIKFRIMKQRIPDAVELARKALKRSPDNAYFYYAITLSADHTEGLRAAKKGLKCRNITPFVRFQLMQRAVEHAGDMGIQILQESPTAGKAKWEEGIAFLMSALDDAKVFVEQAPPDNRHMNAVLYWYILLTIAIKGPELSTDLRELQDAMKGSKIADEFALAIGITPPKTNLRLGQQTVVRLYSAAAAEFGNVFIKAASEDKVKPISPEKLEDDLAAWLEDTHIHDGDHDQELHEMHPKVNTNSVALYRCSWCGNPSAVLRKCSGCSKTRYCDGACQKSHWTEHKRLCNANGA